MMLTLHFAIRMGQLLGTFETAPTSWGATEAKMMMAVPNTKLHPRIRSARSATQPSAKQAVRLQKHGLKTSKDWRRHPKAKSTSSFHTEDEL